MDVIADTAGVAPATVYQAFGTKAAVLAAALDQSIVGDAGTLPLLERDWVAAARKERRAHDRLAMVVTNAATVAARTAPLKEVMRDAAATEPAIRELLDRDDARRLRTQHELLTVALGDTPADADIAAFYLLVNSRSYLLASRQLGWSEARWRGWLVRTLSQQLLPRSPSRPPCGTRGPTRSSQPHDQDTTLMFGKADPLAFAPRTLRKLASQDPDVGDGDARFHLTVSRSGGQLLPPDHPDSSR